MGNVLLKVVKIGLTSAALYGGAQAFKIYGYIRGYSDSSENIFDALDMEDDEKKKETLVNHSEIAMSWKELKRVVDELKNTL